MRLTVNKMCIAKIKSHYGSWYSWLNGSGVVRGLRS